MTGTFDLIFTVFICVILLRVCYKDYREIKEMEHAAKFSKRLNKAAAEFGKSAEWKEIQGMAERSSDE